MKKLLICFLTTIILSVSLLALTVPAATRGIRVKAKTSTGVIKDIPLYSDYYALVIGCSAYRNGWPPLPNAVKDAREVAKGLRGMGWKVALLANPNSKALQRALNGLVAKTGRKKDRAIFLWYSGHGYTITEADGTPLGYIVPVDAPLPGSDMMGFMEKAVNMRRMETVSKGILSRHVLMMFDSCFSGAIFALNRAAPSPYIQEKVAEPVREFITAGSENETVPDRSVFKTCFLQGIEDGYADRNGDGFVTGEELGAYLQEKVVNYTRKSQHPQFGKINNPKLDKGDFVILAGGSVIVEKPTQTREGSLRIKSNPSGAGVWVEGHYKGATTLTLSYLSPGTYRVKVKKDGYRKEEKNIKVSSNRTVSAVFFLDPVEKGGRLYVETGPSNARVRILNIGERYYDGMELDAGRYHLEVSKEGYETEKRWIEVSAGQDARVSIRLTPISKTQEASPQPDETLAVYFKLDGNTKDSSGNHNDGTAVGNPKWVDDRFGNPASALSFDGVDDYLNTNWGAYDIKTQDAYSFSFWIRTTDPASKDTHIFGTQSDDSTHRRTIGTPVQYWRVGFGIGGGHADQMNNPWDGKIWNPQIWNQNVANDNWHHMVFCHEAGIGDGSKLHWYLDGKEMEASQIGSRGTPTDIVTDIYFSAVNFRGQGAAFNLKAAFDDIRIYKKALSSAEVQELYAQESNNHQ